MSLQQKAGNNSVDALIGASGGERSQAQRKPANSAIDSMPLEEAIKRLPNVPPDQALLVLQRYQQFIIRRITTGEERIRDAQSLRAESFSNYLIGGTIELFGGTTLPSDDWVSPWLHVNAAYKTVQKRQVKESLVNLNAAAEATNQRWKQLNEYFDQTEKGADRSIFALQAMQAAGAVAATALTGGGATAIVVGAGYGAAQNLAGQAAAVRIGLQSKIDWGGLAFDTLFGVLTGALGGKLGNTVLTKLMGNKAVASLGRRVVADVVSDLVSGRLSSLLQTTARALFDQLRGKEDLTVEEFLHRLADQLMDPKAMVLDAVMGRASKLAHAPSSRASRKSDSKSSATGSQSPTNIPVHEVVRPPTTEPTVTKSIKPLQTAKPMLNNAAKSAIPEVPVPNAAKPLPVKPVGTAKSGSDQNVGSEPLFELNIGEKRAEQIRSGERNFSIDRALTFDIDEVLPVGAANIKPQRAVARALDPYNRQLLDPDTNQATKGLGIDVRELRENRGEQQPVSVVGNPSALITKRFSEIHELKRIFDRAVASVKEPQKLRPTKLKDRINRETRRIITKDMGTDAVAVRKALASLGFEHQPRRGFTMMKEPQP